MSCYLLILFVGMDERMQRIEVELHSMKKGHLSSTSHYEFYANLVNLKLSKVDANLYHSEWVKASVMDCFKVNFPKGKEKTIVQDFWTGFIPKINNRLKDVEFVDSHHTAILRKKSPDIVLKRRGQNLTAFNVVAVGELKGDKINDSDKGQLANYLAILLLDQDFRHTAFGFITNNDEVLMVQAQKKENLEVEFVWFISETFSEQGKRALSWFSNLSLVDHGYRLPVNPDIVQLKSCLGRGATSTVYHGTLLNGKSVVVKIMTDSNVLKREEKNLETLKDIATVPKVVQVLKNGLILEPCAYKLEVFQMQPKFICEIVDTLYFSHEKDLVHRDIRDTNLFTTKDSSVLVNDWGSAVPKGTVTDFHGAVREGSSNVLCSLEAGRFPAAVPNDDLHALARTIYCKLYSPPTDVLPNSNEKYLDYQEHCMKLSKIREFWNAVSTCWQEIFDLADKADVADRNTYDNFAQALLKQLPYKVACSSN